MVDQPFLLGEWVVDPVANRLQRDDNEVKLEPKVMRVLTYLAARQGDVVTVVGRKCATRWLAPKNSRVRG